jgi:PKD repeat protein
LDVGALPTDTDGDGVYDDVNGNARTDFADVVLYFDRMDWIAANEPVGLFDCNGNGRIDFADVVRLFGHL